VHALHRAALATGIFPIGGIRTRAYETQTYCIADGHPDNAFVHVSVRVGHGRDLPTRRRACEQIFEAACAEMQPLFASTPLGLSVEMQELDPELSFKKNNLHELVKARREAAGPRT
jgi:5-carboxymethyl-2-hydroxymuconate isomerase